MIIASLTSIKRPAKLNGPIQPPKIGISLISALVFLIASIYNWLRPLPSAGTFNAWASSSSSINWPTTVGTSLSVTFISAPKHSASTDKSIKPKIANGLNSSLIILRAATCWSVSLINFLTLIFNFVAAGKVIIGIARLFFFSNTSFSHFSISIIFTSIYIIS